MIIQPTVGQMGSNEVLGVHCDSRRLASWGAAADGIQGSRKGIDLGACGRVLVRRCGRPRAVTARCRSLELSTFPGVENVALAPS